MKNIWRIIKLIPEYKGRIVKVVAINTLLGLVGVAIPYLFKLIVDQVAGLAQQNQATNFRILAIYFGILVAIRFAMILFNYYQERIGDSLWLATMTSLRSRIFHHLTTLSVDYYEKTKGGEIMQRANHGVMEVNRWLFNVAQDSLANIMQLIFILIILSLKSPIVGVIMLVTVPLNILNAIYKAHQTKPVRRVWLSHMEKAMGRMNEMIAQISTVRSFANEKALIANFEQSLDDFGVSRMSQFRIEWQANAIRSLVNSLAIISSVAIITFGALQGRYTSGDIFLVLLMVQQLINSLFPITRLINDTGDVETSAERISELLDVKPTVTDHPDSVELPSIETIEFKNVTFMYPGKKRKVLDRVSFKLAPNQTLALVGPSGVGKSTITKLLLRFYKPSSGQILINGLDIAEFTQNSIRQHIGMVMQDVALFNDTIEDNIRFANPNASRVELKTAAAKAHADIFIDKLPQKYKTLVGERGIKLSGGEKQRVAIARAILKDPQLIILDEATSALDSESERYVQDGLQVLMKNRAAVVIAHRLSTIIKADQILVLKDGRVKEKGTHLELLAKEGLYAKLYSLQAGSLLAVKP